MIQWLSSNVPAWLPYQATCAGLAYVALRRALRAFETLGTLVPGRR